MKKLFFLFLLIVPFSQLLGDNERARFAAAVFVQACEFNADFGKEICVTLLENQAIGPNANVELKLVDENAGYKTFAGTEERQFKYSSVPGDFITTLKVQKILLSSPQHVTYSIWAEFKNTKNDSSLRRAMVTITDGVEKINSVKLMGEPIVIGRVTYKPYLYLGLPFVPAERWQLPRGN